MLTSTYDLIHQQVNKHISNTTIPDIATKAQGFIAVKKGDILISVHGVKLNYPMNKILIYILNYVFEYIRKS
jgi:hypothetical protein